MKVINETTDTYVGISEFTEYVQIQFGEGSDAPYHLHTPEEVDHLIEALKKARNEVVELKFAIKPHDVYDRAVFYVDGKTWRKVIEVHEGRFIVVDRLGVVVFGIDSAENLAGYFTEYRYRKEKAA